MLFKLITYMIISELNRRGTGYRDENVNIESLYFADDGKPSSAKYKDSIFTFSSR